jgi:hypothetical protein
MYWSTPSQISARNWSGVRSRCKVDTPQALTLRSCSSNSSIEVPHRGTFVFTSSWPLRGNRGRLLFESLGNHAMESNRSRLTSFIRSENADISNRGQFPERLGLSVGPNPYSAPEALNPFGDKLVAKARILQFSGGKRLDVTNLIWRRASIRSFSLFAQPQAALPTSIKCGCVLIHWGAFSLAAPEAATVTL